MLDNPDIICIAGSSNNVIAFLAFLVLLLLAFILFRYIKDNV